MERSEAGPGSRRRSVPLHPAVFGSFLLVGTAHVAAMWFGLYRIVTLSLLLAIVCAAVFKRAHPAGINRTWTPVFLFGLVYAYAIASAAWSPSPTALRDAVYMTIAVAPAALFGLAVSRRYESTQIAQGFGLLLLPFAIQAATSALTGSDPMLVGEFTMRTILANALCVAIPVLAGAWGLTKRPRFLGLALLGLLLALSSGSRSAVLFVVPAAAVSIYLADRRFLRRLGLLMIVPALVVLLLAGPAMFERFSAESTSFQIDYLSLVEELRKPAEERVDIERRVTTLTAFETFARHPLFGGGYGSVLQANTDEYEMQVVAHGLIGTLAELGLVGFALLTFAVWRVVRRAFETIRHVPRSDPMLVNFVVSFCTVLSFGLFHQTIESVFFGLIAGVLIGSTSRM